jgi:gamma-glutamyltranspeptidase / glutathione hydrolase
MGIMFKFAIASCLFLLTFCSSAPRAPLVALTGEQVSPTRFGRTETCCTATGHSIAIASGGTHASEIGRRVAREGGNLFDISVAVGFALAVERLDATGIGGGGFALYRTQDGGNGFLDFRETAPARSTKNMYLDDSGQVDPSQPSREGILSVATPGYVAGLWELHRKGGALPWASLVEPAAKLAEQGFAIYPVLAEKIHENRKTFYKSPETRAVFFDGKRPKGLGDTLIQKNLARTLRTIASEGSDAFYRGSLAKIIAATSKQYGGILSAADLAKYSVKYREPLQVSIGRYTYLTAPPPSAGGIVLIQAMKIWKGLSPEVLPRTESQYAHLLAEIFKRGYAERAEFAADPDFVPVPVERLTSDSFTDRARNALRTDRATPSSEIRAGTLPKSTRGTTGFTVIDSKGNSISATVTINTRFGSKVMVPTTGILLNNEMDDFSVKPGIQNAFGLTGSAANSIEPLKRPVSSMTPTLVLRDSKPVLAVSGAGGSRIITGVVQTVLGYLEVFPGDLKRAVFAPRMHHQWLPDQLDLELGYSAEAKTELKSLGHVVSEPEWSPIIVAVSREGGVLTSVSDPRQEGGASAE